MLAGMELKSLLKIDQRILLFMQHTCKWGLPLADARISVQPVSETGVSPSASCANCSGTGNQVFCA